MSETIARFVSVILSKSVEDRFRTYKEMKKFYALRSGLVHRGQREANLIDSNNVQKIAEICVFFVLADCDLSNTHGEFLEELKRASHGMRWPPLKQE